MVNPQMRLRRLGVISVSLRDPLSLCSTCNMGANSVNLEPRRSGETLTTSQRPRVCPLSSQDDLKNGQEPGAIDTFYALLAGG